MSKGLAKKGFREDDGGHHVFFFLEHKGQRTGVYTKVSHGSGGDDIGSPLLGKMARQCRLSKSDLLDLLDCPLSEADYREKLAEGGHL